MRGGEKMTDMKLQDLKLTDHIAGHEIARHEIAGRQIAGHDNAGHEQEAQLSPSDRAMRLVSNNLANYHATVQKLLIRQVLTKPMV